jgi:hypothetical protein
MKKNYNIFDESIPEELKEQHQKVMAQTKEILEKKDEAYKKLIDSIKLKLKELEQSSLDIDEYIVGLMKIAIESRKQLKQGEKNNGY